MDEAEFQAAEERLNKLPFPGVFTLWSSGRVCLDGDFTPDQLEEIARALRGPRREAPDAVPG